MKIRLCVITFAMIICFSAMVSASLYDEIAQLKGKNCNILVYKYMAYYSPSYQPLVDKFGLNGEGDCTFILDYVPYSQVTLDLVWFDDPWYVEIDHIYEDGEEYLILLGKDYSALEFVIDMATNYEDYESLLRSTEGFISIPENYDFSYTGPTPNNCVDNSFESVYTGNSGSYEKEGSTISFSSSCINDSLIKYPYCGEGVAYMTVYPCDCVEGRCIAGVSDVFNWVEFYGLQADPGNRLIDDGFIISAVDSWINN